MAIRYYFTGYQLISPYDNTTHLIRSDESGNVTSLNYTTQFHTGGGYSHKSISVTKLNGDIEIYSIIGGTSSQNNMRTSIVKIDDYTGTVTKIFEVPDLSYDYISDIVAYDYQNIYWSVYNASYSKTNYVYKWNGTSVVTLAAPWSGTYVGFFQLALDSSGNLYGIKSYNRFYKYNTITSVWDKKADAIVSGRNYPGNLGHTYDYKIFGFYNTSNYGFIEYNTITNTWSSKSITTLNFSGLNNIGHIEGSSNSDLYIYGDNNQGDLTTKLYYWDGSSLTADTSLSFRRDQTYQLQYVSANEYYLLISPRADGVPNTYSRSTIFRGYYNNWVQLFQIGRVDIRYTAQGFVRINNARAMPNVVGSILATAISTLSTYHFTVGTTTTVPNYSTAGTILSQSVAAGTMSDPDTVVNLVISSGAVDTSSYIVHQFYADIPCNITAKNVWNEYDEFGLLVNIPRIIGENNSNYKRRIMDVFAHRANSSYQGLIHGITRELGLSLFYPIQINPKRSLVDDGFFAPDPYIKFDNAYLYLYSDYTNDVLDYKIDRCQTGGNYEHLGNLIDFVNSTTYFEASIETGYSRYLQSMTILNQSNRNTISAEDVQVSTKFKFNKNRIVSGTLYHNNSKVFKRERSSSSLLAREGDYYIDYNSGICELYSIPTVGTAVRYEYNVFPFKPIASSIILNDINSEDYRVKLFDQVLQDDGSYEHGRLTELGVDIINELMSVSPLYWGI